MHFIKGFICKIGLHFYDYRFIEYEDQPFADDDMCVTEGYHTYKCGHCGKEKPYFNYSR